MTQGPHRYFVIHKPFGMVSQFISPDKVRLLGDLSFPFPEGTHAIGRLDRESEGLLLLTTDKRITRLLFESKVPHRRTYLVQVRHRMSEESLVQLREGVDFPIENGAIYRAKPCEVELAPSGEEAFPLSEGRFMWEPTTWIRITLTEGRYHQVRKMTAAVRHRCMRLIRVSIEDMELDGLKAGEVREVSEEEFFRRLKLEQ